jgi:hypothetical protein
MWDFLDTDENAQFNAKPLWTIDLDKEENEELILKWCVTELEKLRQENRKRLDEIHRHYKLYKGVSQDRMHRRNADRDDEYERVQVQRKVVINHLYDLTEQSVSFTSKFRPAVQFLPTNDDFHDKQASKLAKRLFDHVKYVEKLDHKARTSVRLAKIAGEGYLFIEWDEDKGPKSPKWDEAIKEYGEGKIPLLDENGNQEEDQNGNPVFIEREIKIGDVCYKIVRPDRLLFETKHEFDEAKYFFHLEERPVEELRADYPKKADMIKVNQSERVEEHYDYNDKRSKTDSRVITLWYKPNKYLPKGRKIVFTPDAILENKPYPYKHGEFPFERMTDIDIPNELHARSFFINARQITAQINNLTTMAVRNIKLCSSPKWMIPKGSVKLDQLNNNTGIVQYQGPIAPQLLAPSTIAGELFNLRNALKEDVQQVSAVHGVSRGEPPAGVKAGVALQFLNEQENERQSNFIMKYNEFIRRVADKTIKVCSQYYDESDERTIAILGKNDEYARVPFDVETLSREFDVRIQNSSALPESKGQRIQNILDLSERFPTLVDEEQVADMLDFGQSEKWYDEATAAVRAAERENEMLMEGEEKQPEIYEYHLQHGRVDVTEVQEKIKDHILGHEMHMMTIGKKNPTYLERLTALQQFPLFFTPDHLAPKPVEEPVLDPTMDSGASEQNVKAAKMQELASKAAMTASGPTSLPAEATDEMVQSAGTLPEQQITQ